MSDPERLLTQIMIDGCMIYYRVVNIPNEPETSSLKRDHYSEEHEDVETFLTGQRPATIYTEHKEFVSDDRFNNFSHSTHALEFRPETASRTKKIHTIPIYRYLELNAFFTV